MRKLSDTMITTLAHVAHYGQFAATDRMATREALITRGVVVRRDTLTGLAQVTDAGWSALDPAVRTDVVLNAWDDAHTTSDVFGTWDAPNQAADEFAAVVSGPHHTVPVPDTYIRQADECEELAYLDATQRAYAAGELPWQIEQGTVPADTTPVHHGPKHQFSHLMAECYCGELLFTDGTATWLHASEMAATALKPLTSVVTRNGTTGRVVSQATDVPRVTVRLHANNQSLTTHEFARGELCTAADLWAELVELAQEPNPASLQLFHVSDNSYVARDTDGLARSLSWGDVQSVDTPTYYSWCESEEDNSAPILFCMLASYGEYSSSSTYDASNYRVIMNRFGYLADPLTFDVGRSTHDGLGVAIRIGDPRWTVGDLSTVVDWMRGLEDYPVISEEDLYAYEAELAEEWWDTTGRSDTLSEVDSILMSMPHRDRSGDPYEWDTAPLITGYQADPRDRDDIIRDLVMHGDYSGSDPEIEMEGATRIYFRNWATMVKEAVEALYAPVTHEHCPCGTRARVLANGTYARHTSPVTRRHCHQSGTRAARVT